MAGQTSSNHQSGVTWISESRSFFTDVIKATFAKLLENEISLSDQILLKKVEQLWLKNYKPKTQQPESNCCPLPKRKRLRKKQTAKKLGISKNTKDTSCTRDTAAGEEQHSGVIVNTLDDNLDIIYRIKIPRLRPNWTYRTIDLKIKAYVCKNNLIEPLINWQLLDSIMALPLSEGEALFQEYVDMKLKPQDI